MWVTVLGLGYEKINKTWLLFSRSSVWWGRHPRKQIIMTQGDRHYHSSHVHKIICKNRRWEWKIGFENLGVRRCCGSLQPMLRTGLCTSSPPSSQCDVQVYISPTLSDQEMWTWFRVYQSVVPNDSWKVTARWSPYFYLLFVSPPASMAGWGLWCPGTSSEGGEKQVWAKHCGWSGSSRHSVTQRWRLWFPISVFLTPAVLRGP